MRSLIDDDTRLTLRASVVQSLVTSGSAIWPVVLPVMAADFGVSALWAGILLAADKVTRLGVNYALIPVAGVIGFGGLSILGATVATASTLALGLVTGGVLLLMARIAAGIGLAAARMASQGYATRTARGAGTRLGLQASIMQAGPFLALVGGGFLLAETGADGLFLIVGAATALAIPFATGLPREAVLREEKQILRPPRIADVTGFLNSFAIVGVLGTMVAVLFVGEGYAPEAAVAAGGFVIAGRRLFRFLAGPFIGRAADRVGMTRLYLLSIGTTAAGFLLAGLGPLFPGLALLIAGGTATTILVTGLATERGAKDRLLALASISTWRDLGGAAGSFAGGALATYPSPRHVYAAMGVVLLANLMIEARLVSQGLPAAEPPAAE